MSQPAISPPSPAKLPNKRLAFLLGALSATIALSIDMYLPALPQMSADLGASSGGAGATLGAFLIGAGLCQCIYGPLSDRFGRRLPLLSGYILFTFGATGCAMAQSVGGLTIARFLQALGGASGVVITRAIVRDLFEERDAARMFSLLMLIMGVAPILAPSLGGQILLLAGWRGIFVFLAVFGILCLLTSARFLPETLPPSKRADGKISEVFLQMALLLRSRVFIGWLLVAGCSSATMFSYIASSPFIFIQIHGLSPQSFGFIFGANALVLIAASQINRALLRRFHPEFLLVRAMLSNALLGVALVIWGFFRWGGFPVLMILLILSLATLGFILPNFMAAALTPFGHVAGSASALIGAAQYLLGGLAGTLAGALFNNTELPMLAMIFVYALIGYVALRLLALPEQTPLPSRS